MKKMCPPLEKNFQPCNGLQKIFYVGARGRSKKKEKKNNKGMRRKEKQM